jgi:hypothetical protein
MLNPTYRYWEKPAKPASYKLCLEAIPRKIAKLPTAMKMIEVTVTEPPTAKQEREILEQAGLDFWKWEVQTRHIEAIAA